MTLRTTPGTRLADELAEVLGQDSVTTRPLDLHAKAHDASHYLLVPSVVASPRTDDDVARLLAACARHETPVTFRSGGTSLSGQAITAGVLADTRRNFGRIDVLDGGARVRVQPGATVRSVNARLARHRRALGPDPASEIACTIGGVVANNSSGMHCGTEANTYRTLTSLRFVLPSGTVIDSGDPAASSEFAAREPALHEGLARLRRRVLDSADSVARIRHQFSMKNTMGYGLNAFLDFEDPLDIFVHLIVGSEGTLAFVAEAEFATVEVKPHVAAGLLVFPGVSAAAAAIPELVAAGADTAELMDAVSLRVSARLPDCPEGIRALDLPDPAALLVEFTAGSPEELADRTASAGRLFAGLGLARPVAMTRDARERAALWKVRKGLYSTVASARPSGTSQLLEDIAVPVPALAGTCHDLAGLLADHGYRDPVIFGHAKDGNLHFMLNEDFSTGDTRRYEDFTEDLVDLVLGAGGTLKAEHGTGRIMAPYVRRQYGDELYEVMQEVKRLADPHGILNPGAVLSDDPRSYLADLKVAPTVEDEVDRCVECGYCEPVCPSRSLTLTPRQRITLRRDAERARADGDEELAQAIMDGYDYSGVSTCAVDGMCGTACPVGINTGDLVRRLRAEGAGRVESAAWNAAAHGWGAASRVGGAALSVAAALPSAPLEGATRLARALFGEGLPAYDGALPGGGTKRPRRRDEAAEAVLFAACIGTMFGPEDGGHPGGASGAFLDVCDRAGVRLRTPEGLGSMCCGTPWKSKGMTAGWEHMRSVVVPVLVEATDGGRLPIVVDASSCAEGLAVMLRSAAETTPGAQRLRVVDAIEFAAGLLPRLGVHRRFPSMALHPTCSSQIAGTTAQLAAIAGRIADEVFTPVDAGCCGFAGDRGLLHPELTASATAPESAGIEEAERARGGRFAEYASSNRTCEIGLTRATGRPYRHILELLAEATRP
ncbi:oxidoreductase [Sinomonas cyclohexanicum]|uniref:D-lactate dehydrogenase (cytochrome) n=1 Tax=Sinomonas cyclohexanicum TaxID=322009 RepID=A0ABN6FLN7_SINCY|nr:FAD-binding and (Fe-S)-binding domain-containing protein [Corynebacterium cyclohexanicum]BCT77745.1 oxidoreductase [Corynebacterium cyclohexanicum]